MQMFQTLCIGQHHSNHCEDYLLSAPLGTTRQLYAVLDGCTMGNESYFAATLCGKILKKIALERSYLELNQPAQSELQLEVKAVVQRLFQELKLIKNQLLLDKYDLLSTLILLIWDELQNAGHLLVVGDGLVYHDGQLHHFDQGNQPDYLGYHLEEDFESWFAQQNQQLHIPDFQNFSICSDGILSFAPFDNGVYPGAPDPIYFLLENRQHEEKVKMLDKKLSILEKEFGVKPTDDLAIIRLMK